MELKNSKIIEPMEIDPKTGLPKLPEGVAWKVDQNDSSDMWVQLVYLQPSKSFFSRMLGKATWEEFHEYVTFESFDGTKEGLLEAATSVYKEVRKIAVKTESQNVLVGIYPPKSIL